MMHNALPSFRRVKRRYAASIIHGVLAGPQGSALLKLHEFEDGHFRAIFSPRYFQLPSERAQPSKSQWNTLKKRLKRRDRSIFIFRDYGEIDCRRAGVSERADAESCLFVDFGFLLN